MWSRRELMMNGVAGAAVPRLGALGVERQREDREDSREIVVELRGIKNTLTTLADGAELPAAAVGRIREQMTIFLRGNGRFPEYCDVGTGVFYQMFDWHVKNAQPLTMGRQPDGRYAMQFMFTRLVLRPESDPGYVGVPYDNR